eukprot:1135948-Rhodomonas_salina.1
MVAPAGTKRSLVDLDDDLVAFVEEKRRHLGLPDLCKMVKDSRTVEEASISSFRIVLQKLRTGADCSGRKQVCRRPVPEDA